MQVHCQDCDATYTLTPSGMVQNAACANCGGKRLERDQPNPTNSDGDIRNMPNEGTDPALGLDQGGNPNQEGIFGQVDGGWQPFRRRDESFASVKTADLYPLRDPGQDWYHDLVRKIREGMPADQAMREWQEGGGQTYYPNSEGNNLSFEDHRSVGPEIVPGQHNLHWTPGMRGRALFIGPHLHSWNTIDPQNPDFDNPGKFHGEYVKDLGVDPHSVDFTTGVDIDPDGTIVGGKHDASQYAQIDPRLKAGGSQQWSFGSMSTESRSLSMDPYMPWTHQADVIAPEAPATPQYSATVIPGHGGVHNGPIGLLAFLDAHVNGLSPRHDSNEIFYTYAGKNEPVEVSVHDPAHLPAAQEIIENASHMHGPVLRDLAAQMHAGTVPLPPGIEATPNGGFNPIKTAAFNFRTSAPLALGLAGRLIGGRLIGGLMGRAIGTQVGSMAGGMIPGMGGGQQNAQPQAPVPQTSVAGPPSLPVRSEEQLSHVTADIETPHTNPRFVETPDGDTRQFDAESTDPAFQNPNVNAEAGGAAQGEDNVDGGIEADQPAFSPGSLETAHLLLPKILDYIHSDKSGLEDPQLKALHDQLEKEHPGYADMGDDNEVEEFLKSLREPHAVAAKTAFQWPGAQTQAVAPPQAQSLSSGHCAYCGGAISQGGICSQCGAQQEQQNAQSGLGPGYNPQTAPGSISPQQFIQSATLGHCEHCRSVTDAQGNCPQCGAQVPSIENPGEKAPNIESRTAGDHQGPTTDEQKKAVAELLIDTGRHEEIPHMLEAPWDYAKEMAEIAERPNVTPNVDPNEQPPPPPPQEIAPPGATMPVPNPAYPSQGGQMISHTAADDPNVVGVPAADQVGPQDVSQEQDSSHTWQGEDGTLLQVGQTYEMHSPDYQIPDIVKIVAVKPDALVVETVGEYSSDPNQGGLNYQHEISREEAQIDGLTFTPSDGTEPEHTPEEQQEDPNGPLEPAHTEEQEVPHNQQLSSVDEDACPRCSNAHVASEMSSPTTTFHECFKCGHAWESKEEDYTDHNTANREWINESNSSGDDFFDEYEKIKAAGQSRDLSAAAARTAGKNFTPREQREFIDEQGVARNADKLELEGTHYEAHRYLGDRANGDNVADEHLFMGF